MENSESIRTFWFGNQTSDVAIMQAQKGLWWGKDAAIDAQMRDRFQPSVQLAAARALDMWASTPAGLLSLILLTDQFPRNIYRGHAQSFAYDALAREWCLYGLEKKYDARLRPIERVFFYLPLEHSENIDHQELSVQLFTKLFQSVAADQAEDFRGYLTFALRHRRVISRFGRFPHRNEILGRESSAEEIEFLAEPGSRF